MITWKDKTSYSQSERGKVEPRTWAAKIGMDYEVVISRHIHYPGSWIVYIRSVIDTTDLLTDDLETAKQRALRLLAVHLRNQRGAITIALQELEGD